jgi:hypothetical protein
LLRTWALRTARVGEGARFTEPEFALTEATYRIGYPLVRLVTALCDRAGIKLLLRAYLTRKNSSQVEDFTFGHDSPRSMGESP